jgi:hypothetical protein
MMRTEQSLKTWQHRSMIAAAVGLVLCAALSWGDPDRLWRAYLFAFLACWLVTMGGLGLLALGNLTGGRWATAGRPFYLALAQTVPLVAILYIPIALSIGQIFPWAGASGGEHALPPGKAVYLEATFFLRRAIGYFIVWLIVAWLLSWVSRFDRRPAATPAMRRVGAFSLVLLVPTTTFAAFDWGMSLEPQWYSSIYGAILTAGGVLAAHSLAICGLATSRTDLAAMLDAAGDGDIHERLAAVTERSHAAKSDAPPPDDRAAEVSNDLGNLLLAFLMVCTYFAFSQFLIIWSANLPTEITWYVRRLGGGWQWLALVVALFHFVGPFLMLLSRDLKRSPWRLARVAALLLAMYCLHLYWNIVPAFADSGLAWHATNLAALAALGGGWLSAYCWHANRDLAACLAKNSTSAE